jgi:hypothetical protein
MTADMTTAATADRRTRRIGARLDPVVVLAQLEELRAAWLEELRSVHANPELPEETKARMELAATRGYMVARWKLLGVRPEPGTFGVEG